MFPFVHILGYQIPIYYLVLSLETCLLLLWLRKRTLSKGLDLKIAWDTALVIMVSAFVGARLFHVIYENSEIYLQNPIAIFYFWNGGFVFYGGALLAGICGWLFLKRQTPHPAPYVDLFTPICSLAYAVGRWGCFLAGCCYGKACDLPWAIEGRHPTQLYASFWEFGVLLILLGLEKKSQKPGKIFFLWLILHSIGRILMETYRDDFRGATPLFSISTWISLILIVLGALGLIRLGKSSDTL